MHRRSIVCIPDFWGINFSSFWDYFSLRLGKMMIIQDWECAVYRYFTKKERKRCEGNLSDEEELFFVKSSPISIAFCCEIIQTFVFH